MTKEKKFKFLETGYASFPLNDINKKFEVIDTIDIEIKKIYFIELKQISKYMKLHMNYKEIEKVIWKTIKKDYKGLIKKADWLVISMITEFGDKIMVSLDMLKEI